MEALRGGGIEDIPRTIFDIDRLPPQGDPIPMFPRFRIAAILVCAASALQLIGCGSDDSSSAPPAPQRELITNRSFESPRVTDTSFSGFNTYNVVSSAVTGWTVAYVDLVHRKLWPAASGNQSIDLNSSSAGRIARRVDTKAGGTYTLSFAIATNPASGNGSPETRKCRVLWNQVPVETLSVVRTDEIAWKRHSKTLVAKGDDSLQIESITGGNAGVALDSMSLMGL